MILGVFLRLAVGAGVRFSMWRGVYEGDGAGVGAEPRMGLVERWLGGQPMEKRSDLNAALVGLLDGARSAAGVYVSEESSLRNTAVLACVRILSQSTAMLPLPVYRRLQPRGKERAPDHPLYPLLMEQANPEMTAFELRRWLMQHVLLYGNGYAEIEWSNGGQARALWPLVSAQMRVERRNGALVYFYTLPAGKTIELPAWKVLHLRGMSGNGVIGFSVVRQLMSEPIGLGLAMQEYGARFFGNGARPGIVLEHPGTLSDKAFKNLMTSWSNAHEGLSNAHRLRILEEGMKVNVLSVPPEEAQFLESRQFQVTEVARAFGVPPHLIGDLARATFSNIEQQSMDFLQYSVGPWLTQIEQTVHAQLMRASERKTYFVEHLRDAILQADTETRYRAYSVGRQWGWLSANDIRERENMNPIEDGDVYLSPMNMAPAGEEPDAEAQGRRETQRSAVTGDRSEVISDTPEVTGDRAWVGVIVEDGARRLARREMADRRRGRSGFEAEIAVAAVDVFRPVLRAIGADGLEDAVQWAVADMMAAPAVNEEERARQIAEAVLEVLRGGA